MRAANGVTIQVAHSDAEGRMVLADTLALAAREKPDLIIDFATLTGACVNALTERYSGAFTNRPQWHDAIEAAGRRSGERVWPFPMDEDYDSDLESSIADVLQCTPDSKGDHILAARFLSRFVPGADSLDPHRPGCRAIAAAGSATYRPISPASACATACSCCSSRRCSTRRPSRAHETLRSA